MGMAMSTPSPAGQNTATTTTSVFTPNPRVPLVERLAAVEERLAKLTDLHNKLAEDAKRELGL